MTTQNTDIQNVYGLSQDTETLQSKRNSICGHNRYKTTLSGSVKELNQIFDGKEKLDRHYGDVNDLWNSMTKVSSGRNSFSVTEKPGSMNFSSTRQFKRSNHQEHQNPYKRQNLWMQKDPRCRYKLETDNDTTSARYIKTNATPSLANVKSRFRDIRRPQSVATSIDRESSLFQVQNRCRQQIKINLKTRPKSKQYLKKEIPKEVKKPLDIGWQSLNDQMKNSIFTSLQKKQEQIQKQKQIQSNKDEEPKSSARPNQNQHCVLGAFGSNQNKLTQLLKTGFKKLNSAPENDGSLSLANLIRMKQRTNTMIKQSTAGVTDKMNQSQSQQFKGLVVLKKDMEKAKLVKVQAITKDAAAKASASTSAAPTVRETRATSAEASNREATNKSECTWSFKKSKQDLTPCKHDFDMILGENHDKFLKQIEVLISITNINAASMELDHEHIRNKIKVEFLNASAKKETNLRKRITIVQAANKVCTEKQDFEYRHENLIKTRFAELRESILKTTNIFQFKFLLSQCQADIHLQFKDFKSAFKTMKKLKKDCEYSKEYKLKMKCYLKIGRIHRIERNYELAIVQFKKMLGLAWQEKDIFLEAKAYEELAVDYFYLGDITKSEFYNQRFMRGKTENDTSVAKQVAVNQISQKRHLRLIESGFQKRDKTKTFLKMPSPSGQTKGTFSKSINILPNYTEFEAEKFNVYGSYRANKPRNQKSNSINEMDEKKQKPKLPSDNHADSKKRGCSGKYLTESKFTSQELLHLNKKPSFQYLNPNKYQMKVRKIAKPPKPRSGEFKKDPIFKVTRDTRYQPFTTEKYYDIVKKSKASKLARKNNQIDVRNISNLSLNRQGLLNSENMNPLPSKKNTDIKKRLESQQIIDNALYNKQMDKIKKLVESLRKELFEIIKEYAKIQEK